MHFGTLVLALAAVKSYQGFLPHDWISAVDVFFIASFSASLVAVSSAIGLYASRADARAGESVVLRE